MKRDPRQGAVYLALLRDGKARREGAPAMDEDGYPDEEELQDIRDAAAFEAVNARDLLAHVRRLWHWPNYVIVTEDGDKLRHEFCTGGWSGNESLISALQGNRIFWSRWWQLSERGGRYVFVTQEPT